MRAPAESTSQKTGSSSRSARSVSRTIFSTVRAPHEPAFTVGSLATTHTGRPSMVPSPVMTPSAGRSWPRALANSPSSTSEPLSSSRSRRSRTNSFPWLASFSASLCRLPRRARAATSARSGGPSDGEDGDVIGDGSAREVASRLEQGLAEYVRGDAGVTLEGGGDALLAEERLAVAHLREPVGVEQREVVGLEGDLLGVVAPLGVEHHERPGGAQRTHLALVPQQ